MSGCGGEDALDDAFQGDVVSSAEPLWSSGDRLDLDPTNPNAAASLGWLNVDGAQTALLTPALAGTGDLHLVDVENGSVLRDHVWSRTDGWRSPILVRFPTAAPASLAGPGLARRAGSTILDLVVRGSDQYYHSFFQNGRWSAWSPIGGWGGDATVTSTTVSGAATVDVWVTGGGRLWRRRWLASTGWQAWQDIGQPATNVTLGTAPGVVVRPGGVTDVVVGATGTGDLYHAWLSTANAFSGWERIDGRSFSKPAITAPSANRLDVWVRGASDGSIYHSVYDANANPRWSGFETTINSVPTGSSATPVAFAAGVSAYAAAGITTIASVDGLGRLLVRSWADNIAAGTTPTPAFKKTTLAATQAAENSVMILPPNASATQAECRNGGVFYSRGIERDLQRVAHACSGLATTIGTATSCAAARVTGLLDTSSRDSQMVRMRDGRLVWVTQRGNVIVPAAGTCGGLPVSRGTETVSVSNDCGKTWTVAATLDPCASGGPFNTATWCNTIAVTVPQGAVAPAGCSSTAFTGTDRPEVLASSLDDRIYMAVSVGGRSAFNLHILRSRSGSLGTWEGFDTGLQSGGAVAMAETATHVFFARAEYGSPSNVGLYALAKSASFVAASLVFVGNIADRAVQNSAPAGLPSVNAVQLSVLRDAQGDTVFRWAYLTKGGSLSRGFSKRTPGGLVTLQSDVYTPAAGTVVKLPTMVSSTTHAGRALLYWYEAAANTSGGTSVRGSMSNGVGRWSARFTLGAQLNIAETLEVAGNDYLKGAYQVSPERFLASWLETDAGGTNRLAQAAVR